MAFDLNKKHHYYFNEIAKIPHGSKNEKALSDYIVQFAKDRGLTYKQDDIYNVIIDKPASEGYENAAALMMQAHIDMVCEKNADTEHDFEKDPLDLYEEDGWLKARGTTLGADDGYGVSYMLAILDDDTLKHPAISCIFTVQEEIGLIGASHLKKEDLHGDRYINLDSGKEVETVVSSAGGARVAITMPFTEGSTNKQGYIIKVRGLLGGHSGGCIHLERGNANKLAARVVKELMNQGLDIQLSDIDGGLKYNAIPRECDVIFVSDSKEEILKEAILKIENIIQTELEFSDEGFYLEFEKKEVNTCLSKDSSVAIINFLYLLPNGFKHKSMVLDNLTTSSLSFGTIHRRDNTFVVEDLVRSALESYTDTLLLEIKTLSDAFGMEVDCSERYGGWSYDKNSKLREKLKNAVEKRGKCLVETASHGGLECGIFKSLKPELDIITCGPITENIHTPEERMDLGSFDRTFEILLEVLEACTD